MRDMYLAILADIPTQLLTRALFLHLRSNDEIPTPRQLRDIVYPPKPVWKPDWAVYVALKKRIHEGYFPLSDERQFLRECESYATSRREDELEAWNAAHLQVREMLRLSGNADGKGYEGHGWEGEAE